MILLKPYTGIESILHTLYYIGVATSDILYQTSTSINSASSMKTTLIRCRKSNLIAFKSLNIFKGTYSYYLTQKGYEKLRTQLAYLPLLEDLDDTCISIKLNNNNIQHRLGISDFYKDLITQGFSIEDNFEWSLNPNKTKIKNQNSDKYIYADAFLSLFDENIYLEIDRDTEKRAMLISKLSAYGDIYIKNRLCFTDLFFVISYRYGKVENEIENRVSEKLKRKFLELTDEYNNSKKHQCKDFNSYLDNKRKDYKLIEFIRRANLRRNRIIDIILSEREDKLKTMYEVLLIGYKMIIAYSYTAAQIAKLMYAPVNDRNESYVITLKNKAISILGQYLINKFKSIPGKVFLDRQYVNNECFVENILTYKCVDVNNKPSEIKQGFIIENNTFNDIGIYARLLWYAEHLYIYDTENPLSFYDTIIIINDEFEKDNISVFLSRYTSKCFNRSKFKLIYNKDIINTANSLLFSQEPFIDLFKEGE